MTPCKTTWKRMLPGLFGASMACAACADALPTVQPPQAGARAGLYAAARADPRQEDLSCEDDLRAIWAQIRLHGSVTTPDVQAPDQRLYWVRDVDLQGMLAVHGRCEAECLGLYLGAPNGTRPARGVCRWRTGDWGDTMRFAGGCEQDRREMHDQIQAHGSITASNPSDPRGSPLLVTAVDDAAVAIGNDACAAPCGSMELSSGVCRWSLFEWGGSLSATVSRAAACLGDYHEMQQQILNFESISVADARTPDTLRHAVNLLFGMPTLQGGVCSAGCLARPAPPAACTWEPQRWGDTMRYHGRPRQPDIAAAPMTTTTGR